MCMYLTMLLLLVRTTPHSNDCPVLVNDAQPIAGAGGGHTSISPTSEAISEGVRKVCAGSMSLPMRGDLGDHVPHVLDKRIERGLRQSFNVTMRGIVHRVRLSRCGADAVGLDTFSAKLRLVAGACGHRWQYPGAGINLFGDPFHDAVHLRVK